MQIVTGYKGTPHITSNQDRAINQGLIGEDNYILSVGSKMAATIQSANEIRIADGVLMMQGCAAVIPEGSYDSVTIASGTAGYNRSDIICARYTRNASTDVENVELVVIQGNPVTSGTGGMPDYNQGDIQAGDTIVDFPLYRVWLTGVNVAVSTLATIVTGTAAQAAQINSINLGLEAWSLRLNNAEDAIDEMIVKKTYTYRYNLAAGGHLYISGTNLGISTPSGYTPIGVQVLWSGNANVSVMGFQSNVSGSSSFCELINHGTAAVSNANLIVAVIYVRSGSYRAL